MRKWDWRWLQGALLVCGAAVLWLGLSLGLVWSTLSEVTRPVLAGVAAQGWPLLLLTLVLLGLAAAWGVAALMRHYVYPAAKLVEEAKVLLRTDVAQPLVARGGPENRRLGALINQLVEQRNALRQEMDQRVSQASRNIELEKSRLAALMSELTQSVVVCNLDGRILLYNNRARLQFKALSQSPGLAGGVELIGLGRSIYGVFDRKLVSHALENIQQRMLRGAGQPSAQFVTTTPAGQLLRVQMAPVRANPDDQAGQGGEGHIDLNGFVLMLENITRDYESESIKDQMVYDLTERSRAALASMQAAIDMLDYPDLEPAMRERFLAVVREETQGLGQRIERLEASSADALKTRWPLEDMLGSDLVSAAVRRIETLTQLPVSAAEVDAALWLKVESFSIIQALSYLSSRLAEEFDVRFLQLRLSPATSGNKVHLDLIWSGQVMSTETVMSWELDSMKVGSENLRLSVRDVIERHGGAFWFERERVRHLAFFRFLLPQADPREQVEAAAYVRNESRPEYYDFDLFQSNEQTRSMDDRRLVDLAYTVFDTETTGLNPSQGDEIIQVGATRIVNGKLLRHESFDQLVDPQRPIPAATIPIHGIQPEMVRGQPTIAQVLPAFHAFVQDTVLVAHNAAFDMRFLQIKEKSTGLVFDQPVLDTLLLSAVVHPNQDSHRLEAIAERFNVTVIGRHTAMGDAMVTAEVFLRLIPLLAEMGIHTLGQAREAAQQTYYARLKY